MTGLADGMAALEARDFQFAYPRDAEGKLIAVVGIRVHDNAIDVVRIHSEQQAVAARVPSDEPDVLFPGRVLWRVTGPASEVIELTLHLPAPAAGSGWLAASA